MSDDVKDFAYYAAKVEETLAIIPDLVSAEGKRLCVAKADVYARLACGAPKAVPPGVCPGRLFPVPTNGEFKICVLGTGHIGNHLTGNGVSFID